MVFNDLAPRTWSFGYFWLRLHLATTTSKASTLISHAVSPCFRCPLGRKHHDFCRRRSISALMSLKVGPRRQAPPCRDPTRAPRALRRAARELWSSKNSLKGPLRRSPAAAVARWALLQRSKGAQAGYSPESELWSEPRKATSRSSSHIKLETRHLFLSIVYNIYTL